MMGNVSKLYGSQICFRTTGDKTSLLMGKRCRAAGPAADKMAATIFYRRLSCLFSGRVSNLS
jgi:hypothetical protein